MQRLLSQCKEKIKGKIFSDPTFKPFGENYADPKAPLEVREAVRAAYIEAAEKMLDTEIPMLTLSLYRDYIITGNRKSYEAPFFKRRQMLDVLNYAEAIERKGRFIDKLADVIFAILEESTWVIPAHLNHDPVYRNDGVPNIYAKNYTPSLDLFSGATGGSLATVYYFHKDALDEISPTICERLAYEVEERIFNAFLLRREWWMGLTKNAKLNNWTTWIISNTLASLLMMKSSIPNHKAEAIVFKAMDALDNLTESYPSDGGCDEGPSYWGEAGAAYVECLQILNDITCGNIDIFEHPFVRSLVEYIAKVHIHGNNYVNFADCHPTLHYDAREILTYANLTNSDLLRNFGDYLDSKRTEEAQVKIPPYNAFAYSAYTWRTAKSRKPKDTAPLKKEKLVYFPGLKVMVARDSEISDEGMAIAIKGGTNGESHNHNDVGSFIAYDKGDPFIIDIGSENYTRFTFDPKTRYTIWYITSSWHNVAEIGGYAQRPGVSHSSRDEICDKDKKKLTMEIGSAYPTDAGVISYVREAQLDNGVITITDDISLNEEKQVDFHFVTHYKPEILDEKVKITPDRSIYFEDGVAASIESYHTEDSKLVSAWKTNEIYRIKLSKKIKNERSTFIIK